VFDATIEVPVTFRNSDKPIGTHVFTAMGAQRRGPALDGITIPQDMLDRIAPTALPRSSIIVSDEPLSRETNYRTEFVAVLNNQPEGGSGTRRPAVDVPVASRDDGFSFGFFSFQRDRNSQTANMRRRGGQHYRPVQQGWLVRRGTPPQGRMVA
jgi:hypothetical protein